MGMDSYKDMADRGKDDDNTNDSNSHPGDGLEGRATLVPPPGSFPTLQVSEGCI